MGFLRPLREAAERESKAYGWCVPENDQYFVMHWVPPRGQTDDEGNLAGIELSQLSFTLCDDIKERLDRGIEVAQPSSNLTQRHLRDACFKL